MGNTVFIENEGRLWPKSLAWANLSPTKRAKIPRGIDVPAIIADPHPRVSARAKVFKIWRYGDSNPRPRHCERRALPTELYPRGRSNVPRQLLLSARIMIRTGSGSSDPRIARAAAKSSFGEMSVNVPVGRQAS